MKITQTRPCIEMIQLLLYQINWPTILDLESVGTGLSSHPILLLFCGNLLCFSSVEILESNLFHDNFTMALYSYGGVNDQWLATSWAVQETGMLPFFLSCDSDMTAWFKGQVEGFRCVWGRRGRPGDTKATGDSKDQLWIIHVHKWLLSRSRGLL